MRSVAFVFLLFLSLFWSGFTFAQSYTQTVKGMVLDKDSRQPLIGATVMIIDLDNSLGATTNENGEYIIEDVPVGRRSIRCQYIGYSAFESVGVIVNSAKTTIINIELSEEAYTTEEVVVTAFRDSGEPVNEMSVVSGRSFSAEETERYAASVNDPSRMALSFPGVQQGSDDNENDIIIRGNSSVGMLWRLEGIDIPNPNHFARPGTSGGGVTIFSAQLISQSDFFSGAMPAEYGNALSGAFDINFRVGNLNEREHRAKIGLLGLDFMTEGPIKSGKSSYLVNYRYSTLGILTSMGVYLVGDRVTNKFQDFSYNLSFQGDSGKDIVTVFGIGGLSEEHYMPVENPGDREPGASSEWEDRIRNHDMAANGITYTRLIDDVSYFKAVLAIMGSQQLYDDDTLDMDDNPFRYNTERYRDMRASMAIMYNRKFNQKTKFKTGIHFNQIFYDYFKEESPRSSSSELDPNKVYGVSIDGKDQTRTVQYFAQFSHDLTPKLTFNWGGHLLGFALNDSWAIDPRVSLNYQINPKNKWSMAYGIHSQHVPVGSFFYSDENGAKPNLDLELMKANHLITGYKLTLNKGFKLGLEAYYQTLRNVPVQPNGDDSYWMLNNQSGFAAFELSSEGSGRNFGIDAVLEKSFQSGMFMLFTGSLFESKYTANSGREYNTRFSTKFSTSSTIGKEILVKGRNTLQFGGRLLYNGGFRYTPYDEVLSGQEGKYVPLANSYLEGQVSPYFRIDGRVSYRINGSKAASIISLDIQNVVNYLNAKSAGYNAVTNQMDIVYHTSGLVPVISYQVDF